MNPVLAVAGFLMPALLLADTSSGAGLSGDGMTAEEKAEFEELEAFFLGEDPGDGDYGGESPELALPDWHWLTTATLAAGYDDNPLRGGIPAGSAFLQPQVEAFGSWLPDAPVRGTVFGFYEARIFNRHGVDPEHLVALHAVGELETATWQWEAAADVLYARQVYDATLLRSSPVRTAGLLTQFQPRITLAGERRLPGGWRLRPSLAVGQSAFEEIDEDYWLLRGEVRLSRNLARSARFEVYLGAARERYLDALARDYRGLRIAGEPLRIDAWSAGTRMWIDFGRDDAWRLSFDAWASLEDDTAGAYYEAWRMRAAPELRWRRGNWDITAEAMITQTDFVERAPTFVSQEEEWHRRLSAILRLRYDWTAHWSSLLRVEFNDLDSNRLTVAYRQRSVTAACTYQF